MLEMKLLKDDIPPFLSGLSLPNSETRVGALQLVVATPPSTLRETGSSRTLSCHGTWLRFPFFFVFLLPGYHFPISEATLQLSTHVDVRLYGLKYLSRSWSRVVYPSITVSINKPSGLAQSSRSFLQY